MTTPATTGHAQSSTLGYPDNTPLHLAQATDLTRLLEKACSALEEVRFITLCYPFFSYPFCFSLPISPRTLQRLPLPPHRPFSF